MKVSAKINIPKGFEKALEAQLEEAMKLTMEDFRDDVVKAQTIPFDQGDLQKDTFTTVKRDKNSVTGYLISDKPYARKQYYGMTEPTEDKPSRPFNYQTVNNPNARSEWLEEYRDGKFLQERFTENLREVRKEK